MVAGGQQVAEAYRGCRGLNLGKGIAGRGVAGPDGDVGNDVLLRRVDRAAEAADRVPAFLEAEGLLLGNLVSARLQAEEAVIPLRVRLGGQVHRVAVVVGAAQ